jgi:hypothetical protein
MSIPATARPFAYNVGSPIPGTQQVGDLAIGFPDVGFGGTLVLWWNGPDENLGYVIAQAVPDDTQPTPVPGVTGSVGFFRTNGFDDNEFVDIANLLLNSNYNNAYDASTGLTANGYWNSYVVPILSLDAGNPLSYPGTGSTWTDTIGGRTFTLFNNPSYGSGFGGILGFNASTAQYAQCNSSLPNLSTWTVGVWHFYTGNNVGSGMCLVTEVYPGSTSHINYSIGDNNGGFSSGFFDGGWRTSGNYSLTPGNWYYIVGSYDGSVIKLYINNNLVAGNLYAGSPISSQGGIRLMRRWDNPDYWDGLLGIVNIYDKALNAGQISTLWNANKSRFGL